MSITPLLWEMQREHGSLRKMAKALGITPSALSKLMNAKQRPSATSCLLIAQLSGKTVDEVVKLAYAERRDVRTEEVT